MDEKYLNYSVEDFTQDINFINWVKNGINQKEWKNFVQENPNLSKDISTATKIVSALRINTVECREDEYELYKKIEIFFTLHHKSKQTFRFRKMMRYAAILVVILAIGVTIPYLYSKKNNVQFSEISVSSIGSDDAKLITANGKEILLKGKQSDLKLNAFGNQLNIDQDSIVRLDSEPIQLAELVVPYGKRSNIQLADGTRVWLNAGSRLLFPQKFTGKNRKVFLKGEAYFEVYKNKDIPFIVSTDKMNVTVYGTEFNMRDNDLDNELEVVLVEGAVSLKENGAMNFLDKEIKLVPKQKAVFNKTDNKTSVESNVDVGNYISWKEGLLVFNQESILSVFKKLSRFYNVRFVNESSVEMNKKISGKLDLKESLKDVLKVVSDAAPITFRIEQDKVIVNSKINTIHMR